MDAYPQHIRQIVGIHSLEGVGLLLPHLPVALIGIALISIYLLLAHIYCQLLVVG